MRARLPQSPAALEPQISSTRTLKRSPICLLTGLSALLQAAFQDVAAFINARRYQDALNVLENIKNKNAMWFYYSAIAMNGIGNTITALEYAKTAAQMEPGNLQYIFLVQQLQSSQGQYRTSQETYGSPYASSMQCCYNILLLNLIMSCCCRC